MVVLQMNCVDFILPTLWDSPYIFSLRTSFSPGSCHLNWQVWHNSLTQQQVDLSTDKFDFNWQVCHKTDKFFTRKLSPGSCWEAVTSQQPIVSCQPSRVNDVPILCPSGLRLVLVSPIIWLGVRVNVVT